MILRENFFFGLLFSSVVLIPFLFFEGLYESAFYPRKYFIFLLTASLWLTSPPLRFQKNPIFFPILSFLFFSLFSLINATDRASSILRGIEWLSYFLLFFLLSNIPLRRCLPKILIGSLGAASVVSLIGLAQSYGNFSYYPQTIAPASTFLNKNFAAEYIAILVPIAFCGSFSVSKWANFCKIAFFIQTLYLFQTQTRGSWVGVAIAFLSFFLLLSFFPHLRIKLYSKRSFWCLLLFPFLLSLTLFWKTPAPNLSSTPIASSEMQRITLWANATAMFQNHFWTGVGLGNFYTVYPLYHRTIILDTTFSLEKQPYELHQDFLQFFVECGLGGGLTFLWIIFRLAQLFWRKMFLVAEEEQIWVCGIGLGLLTMCGQACFSFPFRNPTSAFQFWILAGILLAPLHEPTKNAPSRLWNGIGVLFLGSALCISLLWCISNVYLKRAKLADAQGQSVQALQYIYFAQAYFPWDSSIWREWSVLQVKGSSDWKKNVQVFESIQQQEPYYLNNQINLALAYVKTKQYTKAKQLYEQVLHILPEEFHCLLGLGILYLELQKPEQAKIYLQRAYQQNPTHPVLKQLFQNR